MRADDLLDRLAAEARREHPPAVEVAARVLRTIAAPQRRDDPIFLWLALGSAATAVACVLVALPAWQDWVDPVSQVMIALQGGAP